MKRISIEYGCLDFSGKVPSASFVLQLRDQFTSYVSRLVNDAATQRVLSDLICLRVSAVEISHYSFRTGRNCMPLTIESKSAPMTLCQGEILWTVLNAEQFAPWNSRSDVEFGFSFQIEPSEVRKFNWLLSQLYVPVVKANESNLPFDYQIYNTNEGQLTFQFESQPSQENVSQITDAIRHSGVSFMGLIRTTKTQVSVLVDFGGSSKEKIESLIHGFVDMQGVRKIIFR